LLSRDVEQTGGKEGRKEDKEQLTHRARPAREQRHDMVRDAGFDVRVCLHT
jgi:hypothetical protein